MDEDEHLELRGALMARNKERVSLDTGWMNGWERREGGGRREAQHSMLDRVRHGTSNREEVCKRSTGNSGLVLVILKMFHLSSMWLPQFDKWP